MNRVKKRLLIVAVIIVAVISGLVVYSANQKPSVIPKAGRYYINNGEFVCSPVEIISDVTLETDGKCSFDICGTLVKPYTVKHSLLHGDIVVVDWLKDKELRFKVVSDTRLTVLEDCGLFEKGQIFTLKKDA